MADHFGFRYLLIFLLLLIDGVDCEHSLVCSKSPVFLKSSTSNHNNTKDACSTGLTHTRTQFIGIRTNQTLKAFSLTVLFTSDLHGHLRLIPKLAALKENLRSQGRPVLLLDGGDISIGSIFDRYYGYKGSYEILQLAGYDAITVGNHDDLQQLPPHPPLPILSLNPSLAVAGHVLPSITVNAAGVLVGIIGGNGTASSLTNQIIAEASCLRRIHSVDIVILLTHRGVTADLSVLRGHVDVVLGGPSPSSEARSCGQQEEWHGRSLLPFLVHTGYNAKHFGNITVVGKQMLSSAHAATWEIALSSSLTDASLLPAASKSTEVSKVLLKRRQDIVTSSTAGGAQTLFAFDEQALPRDNGRNCRSEPCFTGRLIMTAFLEYFNCSTGYVLLESNVIRENFHLTVTEESLRHTLPGNHSLVRLRLPVVVLRLALEHSLASRGSGQFLQVAFLDFGAPSAAGGAAGAGAGAVSCAPSPPVGAQEQLDLPLPQAVSGSPAALARLLSTRFPGAKEATVEVIMTDWLAKTSGLSGGHGPKHSDEDGGGGEERWWGAYDFTRGVVLEQASLSSRDVVRRHFLRHFQSSHSQKLHRSNGRSSSTTSSSTSGTNYSTPSVATATAAADGTAALSSVSTSQPCVVYYEGLIAFVSECIAISLSYVLLLPAGAGACAGWSPSSTGLVSACDVCVFSVRVLASAVYWPMYYNFLRLCNFSFGVGSVAVQAKRGFLSSLASATLVTLLSNPYWATLANLQEAWAREGERKRQGRIAWRWGVCEGVSYNLLLVLTPSLKMCFFELFMAILTAMDIDVGTETSSQTVAAGGVMLMGSALVNGLCGCMASLLSTVVTHPLALPLQLLNPTRQVKTNLYETAAAPTPAGSAVWQWDASAGGGGLPKKLLTAAVYDFVSFFSYKIFFSLAEVSPYSYRVPS